MGTRGPGASRTVSTGSGVAAPHGAGRRLPPHGYPRRAWASSSSGTKHTCRFLEGAQPSGSARPDRRLRQQRGKEGARRCGGHDPLRTQQHREDVGNGGQGVVRTFARYPRESLLGSEGAVRSRRAACWSPACCSPAPRALRPQFFGNGVTPRGPRSSVCVCCPRLLAPRSSGVSPLSCGEQWGVVTHE